VCGGQIALMAVRLSPRKLQAMKSFDQNKKTLRRESVESHFNNELSKN